MLISFVLFGDMGGSLDLTRV